VYAQPFGQEGGGWRALAPLAIRPFAEWLAARAADTWATGPGLLKWQGRLPADLPRVQAAAWEPRPESLLEIGLARYRAGQRDDVYALEPIYLRPSSAEEQWRGRG
jgi:tRNA A37 threonylcarbamoyladenosine modification protein TsaB